ncbi:MAG: fluoride efflux transporter CrcB [Granulosicoccaceae bacterium]
MEWLLVALGGAAGAVSRFAVVRLATSVGGGFPLGTLFVNVIGCLIAGALVQWLALRAPESSLRPLIQVGFLGAFTTFSAFSVDSLQLWQNGQSLWLLLNVLANVLLSLCAVLVGVQAARALL